MRSKNGTKRTVRRLAPLLLVAAAVGCRGSETVDAYLSDLDSRHAITASVLVARDGALLVNRGYGLADADRRLPNTPRTRFRIGSITKQFTAAAILVLKERGRLSVQDPVCSYFSPCPQAWSQVTLEHLLTHTSGIPSYTAFSDFPALLGSPVSVDDLAAMTTAHISCPPGGCALGDDTGYGYGWFVAAEPAGTYVYHWGHIDGFGTSNGFYAAQKTFVVVLSNLETTDAFGISTHLAELAAR